MPIPRSSQNPLTKWLVEQCKDVKTLILIGGVAWSGLNLHYSRAGIVDAVVKDEADLRRDVDKNTLDIQKVNRRVSTEVVTKDEFKEYTNQVNFSLTNILQGQQQLYNLIVLQGRSGSAIPIAPYQPRQ